MKYPAHPPREIGPLTEEERATLTTTPEQAVADMDYALQVLRDNERFLLDAMDLPGGELAQSVNAAARGNIDKLRRVRARLERAQERDKGRLQNENATA